MSSDHSYYRHVSEIIDALRPSLPPAHRGGSGWTDKIKRVAVRSVLVLCVLAAGLYVGDYLVFRYRVSRGYGLGSVNVEHLYAIPLKSGKTEFDDVGTEAETCVHSLFPRSGYAPCWYLSRHTEQRTNF